MCTRSTAFNRGLTAIFALILSVGMLLGTADAYADDIVGTSGMLLTDNGEDGFSGESTLGNACADAVRLAVGTDFALLCSGVLGTTLCSGEITWMDVQAAFSDGDCHIVVAYVTVPQLVEMLEYGLSAVVLDETESIDRTASAFDGFPQISGFTLTYDTSAIAGERVMRIKVDGESIDIMDEGAIYTLAMPESLFDYGYPALEVQDSGITLAQALADYASDGIPDDYTDWGRITAAGSRDSNVFSQIPSYIFAILAVLGIAFFVWRGRRLDRGEFDN